VAAAGSSSLPQRRSRDGRAAPRIERGDQRELPISRLAASLLCYHIVTMARTHPHAEATYRVIALPGGTFGVEVSIPDAYPTTVSTFATKADAEAWIAKHKSRVEAQSSATGWFRASRTRTSSPAGC